MSKSTKKTVPKTTKRPAEKTKKLLRSIIDDNIDKWKKLADCKNRFNEASKAVQWVKTAGNFSINPAVPKDYSTAMYIDASHNLEDALDLSIVIGLICQESSFGTNFPPTGSYRGPFQLASAVITEFNNNNTTSKLTHPGDIDELTDLEKASRAAAWFYAMNCQRLTKNSSFLNPVSDIAEAKKFALASYNGGPTLIKEAREITTETTGGEREIWSKVQVNLEVAGATASKAKEIREYVDFVLSYSAKSDACWCNNC